MRHPPAYVKLSPTPGRVSVLLGSPEITRTNISGSKAGSFLMMNLADAKQHTCTFVAIASSTANAVVLGVAGGSIVRV